MALAEPEHERIIEGETLRGIEREVRDLVLSLKALTALLRHEPDAEHEDPVLTRILEAELNQLAVLVGEVCTALKVEERGPRPRSIDLSQALHQAARRSGVRALVRVGEPVPAAGDPEVVSQTIQSALAIAVRISEGRVTVHAERAPGGGYVQINIPAELRGPGARKRDARLMLLRRLLAAQGGRLSISRRTGSMTIRLWFPHSTSAGERRAGSA